MTQKERILVELIRVPDGLTAVELVDRTGLPMGSLRTTLWALRKEGLLDVVGGVRGRYRYGVSSDGRAALAQSSLGSPLAPDQRSPQAALFDSAALGDFRHEHRTLRGFVRWLAREHPNLFTADQPALRQLLDELVVAYLEQDYDPVRQMFQRALWDSREKERDED